jgi:hypothetical protein
MKYANMFASAVTALAISGGCAAENSQIPVVGNRVGNVAFADGPGLIGVDMNNCRFSMDLARRDHIKFNDPDVVIYQAAHALPDSAVPHLVQSEMAMGYDWSFEKKGGSNVRWLGLMCESESDFSWGSATKTGNVSPELQDIMEANAIRCPAEFDGKKWMIHPNNEMDRVEELHGKNWSGFIASYRNEKDASQFHRVRFCLVHGGSLVVGVSEGGSKSSIISRNFVDNLIKLILSVEFIGGNRDE